jgi:glycosyltransferase involved in cell wall biosynthesis
MIFLCVLQKKIYPPILFNRDNYLIKKKNYVYNKTNFHIVCPSKWILNIVDRTILKYKEKTLIYNGVDRSVFKKYDKEESRKTLDLPQDKKIILFIAAGGKKNPFKGGSFFDELVYQYRDNDKVIFLSVGSNIKKRVVKKNSIFIPSIKEKELLAKLYSAADILLNPTLADNLPTVILEAYNCGLPAVTFNTGGTPEIVDDNINGYIAKYKDSNDLKDCLDKLIKLEPEKYDKFSKNALAKSSQFNKKEMFESYLRLYNDMI